MSALISVLAIYFFIVIGLLVKKIFTDEIHEKTLILISIYFLQPILTFWGLTRNPIDFNLVYTPFIYFITITFALFILYFVSKLLFDNEKDKSIFITTSLIGNTGNLGIPLGIALFGESSVAYTSIINIANIFFIYTVGIYFFAKSSFTLKESIKTMVKIPILWFAFFALIFNYLGFKIIPQIDQALEMGAYSAIVLQLIIFGIYLAKVNLRKPNYKLSLSTSSIKLFIVPMLGIIVSLLFNLDPKIATILIVSLSTPLAVNTVNIAALYDCKPYDVTHIVLFSTLLFLVILYFDLQIIYGVFK